MNAPSTRLPLTFSVYPTARGFGWIAFEGPLAPYDWELVEITKDKNVAALRRIEELIERLQPETLVLEAFERRNSARSDRIANLCRALVSLAASRGVEVAIYGRRDIETCFATVGARTRHEIAEAVARHVEGLRERLPKKRLPWNSEDRRMALFNAAALVITHYARLSASVLDDLRDAA
ncbi:MAG TPA: hypothetical protein VMU93_05545 [Caulobacteraceae bacterium]|nr:hypothetical protein [Caulobacteraceae bacterium]